MEYNITNKIIEEATGNLAIFTAGFIIGFILGFIFGFFTKKKKTDLKKYKKRIIKKESLKYLVSFLIILIWFINAIYAIFINGHETPWTINILMGIIVGFVFDYKKEDIVKVLTKK